MAALSSLQSIKFSPRINVQMKPTNVVFEMLTCRTGLPDGIFSNQKFQFGKKI
jgi:hypothetical protein